MNLAIVIIVASLVALFLFDVTSVVLSYAFSWYEKANQNPALLQKRSSAANLRLIALLFIAEIFFNLITLSSIPLGWLGSGRTQLEYKQTPILLLHGLFVNQSCWFWFKMQLRARGYNIV